MNTIFLLLLLANFAFAQENECLPKIKEVLETNSELTLYSKRPFAAEAFNLKCEDTDFGNSLYTTDSFVFIHEAAHFEDLNITPNDLNSIPDSTELINRFNFFSVNSEHIGNFEYYSNLPKIKEVIRPYLSQEKPEFLEEDSIFMSMHDGYIGADDGVLAAEYIQGLATELNGYTHGAIIQSRMLPLLPNPVTISDGNGGTYIMPNPYSNLPSQLDGIMYFLYNFNLYLRLVKENHPEIWNEFYTNSNKQYLNKILSPSIQTLVQLDHCDVRNTYENVNFYINELLKEDTSVFIDILGEAKVNALTCSKTLD